MPVQVCFGPLMGTRDQTYMQFFEVCCRGSSPYRLCTGKYDITHGKLDPHAFREEVASEHQIITVILPCNITVIP